MLLAFIVWRQHISFYRKNSYSLSLVIEIISRFNRQVMYPLILWETLHEHLKPILIIGCWRKEGHGHLLSYACEINCLFRHRTLGKAKTSEECKKQVNIKRIYSRVSICICKHKHPQQTPGIYKHSHTFVHHNLWLAYLICKCIKSPTSVTPTYVATNTVRALIFPSMSAHLIILGLILWFDPAINVNHVSTAQGCKPLREIGNGGRGRGGLGRRRAGGFLMQ